MATRHDIIHIDFQVNAGKANPAIESLRVAAQKTNTEIEKLKKQLADGRAAGMAKEQIEDLDSQIRKLEKDYKGFGKAERELVKGVGQLSNAIKAFNDGTLDKMSAAFQKASQNAVRLAKTKLAPDSETYKKDLAELNALEQRLTENIAKAKLNTDELVATIQRKGKVSVQELTQEADGLREILRLIPQGTKQYNSYANSLTVIEDKLNKISIAERRAAGRNVLNKAKAGGFAGASEDELNRVIAKLREYQSLISNPKTLGKKQVTEITAEIEKLRAQLDGLKTTTKEMEAVLNSPKGKSFNELKAAVEQAEAKLRGMRKEANGAEYDMLAQKIRNAKTEMKALGAETSVAATKFEKAWSRLKTYIGLYMGAAVVIQKITATMGDLMELSDRMGEVRKTTGFTADEVGRLSDSLAKLDTRTPIQGLMELSAVAGQLGLKTEKDVRGFTEAANMLMVALPEMGKEGATAMLKVALATGEIDRIRQQLQDGTVEGSDAVSVAMTKIGSTIDALRANSAAAAPAITDFVKRVGAVGAQSGITIDQVAALGSTVDALGMRVEMSATALSRMIPAIKNNAFELAKAIGVTPDTIRNLFEAGRGMEAVLMILQHIKDSGMDADSVESMLGVGGMGDVMKDLNQQGARAGIVFAGLSQNVDELRRQLGVASQAYKENIAIQNEYNKMNDTTAAKWERLKNQFEEMFVSDEAQRFLGNIIDGLRTIVDLVSADGPLVSGLKYLLVLWASAKIGLLAAISNLPRTLEVMWVAVGRFFTTAITGLKALTWQLGVHTMATARATVEWRKMNAAMMQNVWGAVAMAIMYAVYKLIEWNKKVKEAREETGKLVAEMAKAELAAEENFKAVDKASAAIADANKKLADARKHLEDVRKQMDGTKESAERLAKAEKDVARAEGDVAAAREAHLAAIEQINKEYGQYLGFVLSDISSQKELANAQELVNSKLRESIILRRKEAAVSRVEEEESESRDEAFGKLGEQVRSLYLTETTTKTKGKNGKVVSQKTKVANTVKNEELLKKIAKMAQEEGFSGMSAMDRQTRIRELLAGTGYENYTAMIGRISKMADDYAKEYQNVNRKVRAVEMQFDVQADAEREESQEKLKTQFKEAGDTYKNLQEQYTKSTGDAKKKAAANLLKQADSLEGMIAAAPNYYDLANEDEKKAYDKFVKDSQDRLDRINENREALLKEAGSLYKPGSGSGGGGGGGTNPWGGRLPAESTDYKDMNAELLVTRRKQMANFVRSIQTDTDVNAVLKEDAALRKAIENGMSSDMRTVIEWYNTERLKIQDELHARHLTNTGDWMDPAKKRGRQKTLKEEWKAYLDELDAYYTERNSMIQDARNNEEISEAEAWRRTIANESEWHQRRAELQQLYANKSAKVTESEQKAIFDIIASRTEDTSEFIEKNIKKTVGFILKIGEKSEVELAQLMGHLDKGIERDFLKQQKAIGKQVQAIEDIIDKERPFNGITENLRENLIKMGILTADLKDEESDVAQELKRLSFLLRETEHAYSVTIDQLLNDMRQEGFAEWADAISKDESMKQGLLAMLHSAYDEVQNAIKKESSLIKKQVEILWNDTVLPGGLSAKNMFESGISRFGQQQSSVSRANSLIGAGYASETVADKLAIKQMQVRLAMQQTYFNLIRKTGMQRIEDLKAQAKLKREEGRIYEAERLELDAQHAAQSLNLSLSEEQKKVDEQRLAIAEKLEESQNRLYKELREWANLLSSSLQSVFEASNTGQKEFYNERAKLRLTGGTGEMQTLIVIDNAGTSDAEAHYEYLTEMEALERKLEIEQHNAVADAWKKVMDDINMKMNDMITDQVNALLQNASTDANTDALGENTKAILELTARMGSQNSGAGLDTRWASSQGLSGGGTGESGHTPSIEFGPLGHLGYDNGSDSPQPLPVEHGEDAEYYQQYAAKAEASHETMESITKDLQKIAEKEKQTDTVITKSSQSAFAKMTQAANLYGIAYQAMSNDNMTASQKFGMIAVQAAGNSAMAMLTADFSQNTGEVAGTLPAILAKCLKINPIAGAAIFAVLSGLIGGLMGLAASKIAKSKSEIAAATGVSANVASGRLTTGMLTYAEGNVNEFTNPNSLTPGRSYNVDAADGRTYRARYTGNRPSTHITNGPEFHLAGERGREMIIDADTTRQITMDERGIWQAIQTLSSGGRLRRSSVRRHGIGAFADGNLDEFDDMGGSGMSGSMDLTGVKDSLDRNSAIQEALLERLSQPIQAKFDVYGQGGLVDSYDKGKKTVTRYGQPY